MLFIDPLFLFVFLPVAVGTWALLGLFRARENSLLLALIAFSLLFYSWTSINHIVLLVLSISINWIAGAILVRAPPRASWAIASIIIAVDLLLLGFFKYLDFLSGATFNLVLPLGISFFTFQQISYIADAYKSRVHENNFLRYAFIVSFFPHLIAGPIVRYSEFRPQFAAFARGRTFSRNLSIGLALVIVGLAKKIVLADSVAPLADTFFGRNPDAFQGGAAIPTLLATFAFYLQIYFDFSGYTDIAIGIARIFNIKFPKNFDYPYSAASVSDFWQRWHITLSRFLRDYLYIPLGGNRVSRSRTAVNLMVTMLLGGLWHGAAWNFVVWGGLHGLALLAYHHWSRLGLSLPFLVAWTITQLFVGLTWIVFRAPTLSAAVAAFRTLGTFGGADAALTGEMVAAFYQRSFFRPLLDVIPFGTREFWLSIFLVIAWGLATFRISAKAIAELRSRPAFFAMILTLISVSVGVALWVRVVRADRPDPFIYFQF